MKLDKSPQTIQTMFNVISDKYDFINKLISFGTQSIIKQSCINLLKVKPYSNVLDLCTGTGDMSRFVKKNQPKANVIGIDFSEKMIEIAKNKNNNINYFLGDVTNLPFSDNMFDYAIMSFGLRNILNSEKAIDEVYRILKPNGLFLHLDFGEKNCLNRLFDTIVPHITGIFTENKYAYDYLINSKRQFLVPDDLIKDFESKGFVLKIKKNFIFNTISCQIMEKPYL